MPTHVVFLSLIYPVVGIILAKVSFEQGLLLLLFPLTAGFTLIGAFAAVGLCELSRRRERQLDLGWWHAFDVLKSSSFGSIAALAILLTVIFLVWLEVAQAIYVANFGGLEASSITHFVRQVFTTGPGWRLIIEGKCRWVPVRYSGADDRLRLISAATNHKASAATAVLTSIRVVFRNPSSAVAWGFINPGRRRTLA
jgi:uncharacterized membrane protein